MSAQFMSQLTIQEVVKIIPLPVEIKDKILADFDMYSEGKKYEIKEICWGALFELFEKLSNLKYEELFYEASEGKGTVDETLMQRAKDAVWEDFQAVLSGKKQDLDEIDTIREKLKTLSAATGAVAN